MADRSVTVRLSASISDYMAKMSAASKATGDLARQVEIAKGRTAEGFRTIGTASVAAGGLVVAGFAAAAKAAADFDAKMALVRTLSKASAFDMTRLRNAALTVGQAYGFSATEVADAQAELVKAGISVSDILGGALVGALTLASAGQTDVATATQIAAAAMTQFQLSGKDIPHLADLLAAGADKALGSVSDLGYGLSQVGTTAHQFGISVDETVGTLAALANAGQIGEKGGTELNQMLLKLSAGSHQATAEMKLLGLNAYDAQGNFVGLANFAGQLHDKLGPLTQAERTHAETVIFGSRAIKAANVLYAEGARGIQEWVDKVNAAGFAELQSKGKLESLSGDWQKFTAALQAAMIQAGEGSQGPLRQLVQTGTSLVETWSHLPAPIRDVTEALALLAAGAAILGGTALLLIPRIAAVRTSLAGLGTTGTRVAGVFGKGGLLIAGVTLTAAAVSGLEDSFAGVTINADALSAAVEHLGRTGQVTGALTDAFGSNLKDLKSKLNEAGDGFSVLGFRLHLGMSGLTHMGSSFKNARTEIANLDQALASLVQGGDADLAAQAWKQLTIAAQLQGVSIKDLTAKFPAYAGALAQSKESAAGAADGVDKYGNAVDKAAAAAEKATKAAKAYSDALHAAADPLFAMNQALQDLHDKQKAASDAAAKYGASSRQAHQANLDLAQSMLNVQANATTLAGAVKSGAVSIDNAKAMLHAFIREGGLTKAQAHDILGAFDHLIGKSKELNRQRPVISVTADTTPAMLAIGQLVSTLTTDVGHAWNFLIGTHSSTPSRKPGRASGGGAPDGFFAVGEQGPELAFKDGSNVHIFSNSASRAMIGATGMSVPGFAGGTTASQRYEKRLHSIISDRGASSHDIRRAVEALTELSAAWDATLRRIGNRQQLHSLQHAIAKAGTPSERNQAEKQLAQFRRQREQDAATRRIQAAQDLATNRQTWLFERMSVKEQISYLDKAMDKEKRFSDQWLQDAEQRRSLRQSQKQDLAGNKAQWQFENMSAQQQIAFLDKKIAKEKKYSDQWLADMEQRKSLQESLANNTATTTPVVNNPISQPGTIPDLARYATGGPVAGYGSGTSDSIYSRLSNGEYVEPAAATAKYGPELSAMRAGTYVPAQGGGGDIHVHVTMSGPVAGDWQALGKKIAEPVYQELRRHARTRGPVTF